MAFEGPHPDPGGVLRARPAARAGRSELLGRRGKSHGSNARPPAWGTHLERDHYDIVWAAYNDRTTLINAVRRHVSRKVVKRIVAQAQQSPQALVADEEKPVRNPKAPGWHDVLGDVWKKIEAFTSDAKRANIALPALKGAKGRKPKQNDGG